MSKKKISKKIINKKKKVPPIEEKPKSDEALMAEVSKYNPSFTNWLKSRK